jgi:PAS domain S-box-containing protein
MKKNEQVECLVFETMIAELSSKFINLPSGEIDKEIKEGLRRLVEFLDVGRSVIMEFSKNRTKLRIRHIYKSPGIQSLSGNVDEMFPWYTEKVRHGVTLKYINLPDELPEEALHEREYCLSVGLKSSLTVPLNVGESLWGGIIVESFHISKDWSEEQAKRLKLVGEIFANAFVRKQVELSFQKEQIFNETLIQASPAFITAIRQNGKVIMMNHSMLNRLGYTLDEVVDKNYISTFVPQSDQTALKELFEKLSKSHEFTTNENRVLTRDGKELLVEWHGMPIFKENDEFDFFIGVGIDRTERRKTEMALQKAFSEIKQLEEQLQAENVYLREEIRVEHNYGEIVGDSNAIKKVLSSVEQVANTGSVVLIMGETGTGKELVARALHNLSPHKMQAMVKVNCAALTPTLIEAELFGREKGAYTGAVTEQMGRFEIANGSTLFLDEIGELPLELQAKLLRVLQESEFERLGGTKTIKVDVRVIAATNRNLNKAVQDGSFREDLFYRLNVFPIFIPPLRERQEDIPPLVWSFIREFEVKMGKRIETIPQKTMDALQGYPWPGNVRELKNIIEHAMIITKDSKLECDIPTIVNSTLQTGRTLRDIERKHIIDTLEMVRWRVSGKNGAAEILGLKPTTLEARMKKLGINRPK